MKSKQISQFGVKFKPNGNGDGQVFWGEIAPCEHLIQIYENNEIFLHALEGFAGNGLLNGDNVIVIATRQHLDALKSRLKEGFDINHFTSSGTYIALDAEEILAKFMIDEQIDENRFRTLVKKLIVPARKNASHIRVFGEMVAILWGQGNRQATFQLEKLWNELCRSEHFSLFCAYPKPGFRQDVTASVDSILGLHSKIVDGERMPSPSVSTYGDRLFIHNRQ